MCGRGERLALALAREQINGIIEVPAKARVEVDIFELQRDSQYETTDTSEWGLGGVGRGRAGGASVCRHPSIPGLLSSAFSHPRAPAPSLPACLFHKVAAAGLTGPGTEAWGSQFPGGSAKVFLETV